VHNSHFVIRFPDHKTLILRRLAAVALLAMPLLLIGASPAPSIDLSRTSGTPGTTLVIHATGFPPGEIVALYIDQPNPYLVNPPPGPRAGTDGTITDSFTWPGKSYDVSHVVDPSKPGVHTVCGDTGYPGSDQPVSVKACAQFTVVGPSPTPTPPAGSDGGPNLPLPIPIIGAAIVVVLALAIGGQVWLQRQSKK
jgi:hypothetical protein